MEKSAAALRKFRKGLLTSFLFFFFSAPYSFSRPSYEYIKSLSFKAADDFVFTQTDSAFVLEIEDVTPDNVTLFVENVQENVSFVSSRKETLMKINEADPLNPVRGTKITAWFSFSKPGTYRMRNLLVSINKGGYSIPFQTVTVYENPRVVQPRLSVEFANPEFSTGKKNMSVYAGEHIVFTVYIRYAMQIVNFEWAISEDSIFHELNRYEITKGMPRGSQFSPDAYPIATFDWQPLKSGTFSLPEIYVTATAYNGSRVELEIPEGKFKVQSVPFQEKKSRVKESAFAYAFSKPLDEEKKQDVSVISDKDMEKLLELRKAERHSFPWSSKVRERKSFELEIENEIGVGEASIPLFITLSVIAFVTLLLSLILFLMKKIRSGSVSLVAGLVFLTLVIVTGIQTGKKYALYEGGNFSAIPEYVSPSGAKVPEGARILISKKAGKWLYVRYNDNFGWIPEEDAKIID